MNKETWKKIEALFQAAAELPDRKQSAFLDAECGDDAGLRKEVESLLKYRHKESVFQDAVQQAAHSLLEADQQIIGQRIGPYVVTELLGEGGMGAVYLAERADDQYHKKVAIKMIRTGAASKEVLRRFRVERQILASLEHPYIARLLDGGTTDSGSPYLVMEYVEGEDIDSYCERNRLPIRQRLALFRKVCGAVQYAHQRLVVHRDLKPTNILITREGEPRLLDFGIAKLLEDSDVEQTLMQTRADSRLLTPYYSSPEQVRGEPVSTVTDVYALGIILYELITGKRPYGLTKTDRYSVEQAVLKVDPVRPSTSVTLPDLQPTAPAAGFGNPPLKQVQRQLRGDLDNIVLKALRKEPERRYISVAQLSHDIGNYLAHKPVSARADTWSYRAGKFVQRNRFSSMLAAMLVILITVFSLVTWQQSKTVEKQRDLARTEATKAEAVSGFLRDMLMSADPAQAQGKEVTVREMVDKAAQKLEKPDDPIHQQLTVEAAIQRTIGIIYTNLGELKRAEKYLQRALDLHRSGSAQDKKEFLQALLDTGWLYSYQFRHQEFLSINQEALPVSRALYGEKHRHTLGILNNLAESYNNLGETERALPLFREVYHKRKQWLGPTHHDTLDTLAYFGSAYENLGEYNRSIDYYRQCFTASTKAYGERDWLSIMCQLYLGRGMESAGQYQQAVPILQKASELSAQVFGAKHPDTLTAQHQLGYCYLSLKQYQKAEALFRQLLPTRKKVLGDKHTSTLQTQVLLSRVLRETGRYSEAEFLLESAIASIDKKLAFSEWTSLLAQKELGGVYQATGRNKLAQELFLQIIPRQESLGVPGHAQLQAALTGAGTLYLQSGNINQARIFLDRALTIADKYPDQRQEEKNILLEQLARTHEILGDSATADGYRAQFQEQ